MFIRGMEAEEFKKEYGYLPGSNYQGGQIDQEASGVDGDHIIIRDGDGADTYHTHHYRQRITASHIE